MREPNADTPKTDSCQTPLPDVTSLDSISADLESRLRAGESIRCEFYFSQNAWLANDLESAMDLIFTEYDVRCDLCDVPHPSEYFDRFPQWQKELDQQFELARLFDGRDDVESSRLSQPSSLDRSKSRFQVTTLLARGGIGQVMRALDSELNREVAVKEIQPRLAANEDVRERFLREAEITGRLEHPGVVPVYGLGQDDKGRPFYAMRLVRGQSFLEAIEAYHAMTDSRKGFSSLEFQKLLRRFLSVCDTVAYAHSRGVIHRDIKPQNILLGPFGETLLVDWGLAKVSPTNDGETTSNNSDSDTPHERVQVFPELVQNNSVADWSVELTQSIGSLIGTPAFMSPEQASGDASSIGPMCDVYSLGATLYALLTGRNRFGDSDVPDTIQKIMSGGFPRPREWNRSIPVPLEAICLKAMALAPSARYPSVIALSQDIEHYLADERVSAAPESFAGLLTRWGRRNRNLAIGGLVGLFLVTCVSLVAVVLINGERVRADRESIEARKVTARLAFDRGYQLIEQHQFGEGLLWLQRSLHHTPSSDTAMRRVLLSNFSAAKNHLLHRQVTFSHDRSIAFTVFSSDGKYLLTSEGLGLTRIWDLEHCSVIQELEWKQSRLACAQFNSEGDLVLVTALGGKLTLHKFAFLPQSNKDLNADSSSTPSWNDQRTSVTIECPRSIAHCVLSHDSKFIAYSCRESSLVRIYHVANGQLLDEIESQINVQQIVFQPVSNRLAIVGTDANVRIWELEDGNSKYGVYASFEKMVRIEFTPDGKSIVAGNDLGSVAVWNVVSKRLIFDFGRHTGWVTAVACSSDGKTIAGVWDNGIARAWDLQARRPVCEWLRLDRHTNNLGFRPHTNQMLVVAKHHSAILWDLPDPNANSLAIRQTSVDAVDISPDGNLAIVASRHGNAKLLDPSNGEAVGKPMVHMGPIKRVGFRPDGAVIVTAGLDGIARLWNAQDGTARGKAMDHRVDPNFLRVSVESIAFSFDSRWLATGDSAGYVRIWDADTGELLRTFSKVNASALSLCFGPRNDRVLVGYSSPDNGVRMWQVESSELLWTTKHRAPVRSVALSPNGEYAISGGNDETARLWNSKTGQPITNELPHRGEVFVVRFSPDSRLAVTGGYDATVRLWHTSGMRFGEAMHHDAVVLDAAFSLDGKRLLTSSVDKTARLWDVATCLPLSLPLRHNEVIAAAKFSPTNNFAVAGRFWRLPTPMPDQPDLIERWVRLATQRSLDSGNIVQWLDPNTVDNEASEFERLTHSTWSEWSR